MAERTAIAWCDHTFSPWWGCTKVSDGCAHCYAETVADRFRPGLWGPRGRRRVVGEATWKQPLRWNRAAARDGVRRRVFCGSMCDVFEKLPFEHPDWRGLFDARQRLWKMIVGTPYLDWMLLTKRPANAFLLLPLPRNAWLGVSAATQAEADERIPILLQVPAAVRFVSAEPLLSDIDLFAFLDTPLRNQSLDALMPGNPHHRTPGIDWVIIGGESGPRARPCDVEWIRSLVRQCRDAGTAAFVKQLGSCSEEHRAIERFEAFTADAKAAYPVAPSRMVVSNRFHDRAGADPSEWPDDLRVREWPTSDAPRKS